MKNAQRYAFTLVELLITITIMALIAVVAFTSMGVRQNNAINSKVTSEVETLTNALLLYKQEKSELPLPKGNLNFFAEDTSYVHDYDNAQTFAAHGFITHDTLAKKYIDVLPIDPRTGSFYAYGKTKGTGSLDEMYEIASVIWKNNSPVSYVTGDYTAETGPYNLIRSYNGPEFVRDKSETNFPYNPQERILTAKIDAYSGAISINGNIYSESKVLDYELRTGDTIEIAQDGVVELYFSDGSRSVLGDTLQSTKLTLQKMDYKQDNNLVTDIKLVLESGMIWNKAASLDDQSEFEIYTVDSTAAVRGTLFGIQKNTNASQIVVIQGSVAVQKNNIITSPGETASIDLLKQAIDTDDLSLIAPTSVSIGTDGITIIDGESIIEVNEGDPEVGVEFSITTISGNNTDSSNNIPTYIIDEIINNAPKLNINIKIKLREYSYTSTSLDIALDIPRKVYEQANVIVINDEYIVSKDQWSSGTEIASEIVSVQLLGTHLISDIPRGTITSSLIPSVHADSSPEHNIIRYITDKNIKDLEIRFGKYNPNDKLLVTGSVKIVLIEGKSYNGDQDISRQDEIIGFENEQIDRTQACDGFEFTNDNDEFVCADADNDLLSQGWEIVAYAPYDNTGDLHMYSSGGEFINDHFGSGSNNITGIDCERFDTAIQCSSTSDTFGASSYDNSNSFVEYSNGVKGIFVDNTNTDDRIKYDIRQLGLENLEKFVIEFSVRGKALKRIDGNYFLLDGGNDKMKLYLTFGELKLNINGVPNLSILQNDINASIGFDNDYYQIFIIKNNGNFTLKIGSKIKDSEDTNIKIGQYQYVGSQKGDNQWNDVIDYVKIYQ